ADVGVVSLGRVEVVVVGGGAGLVQALGLAVGEQAEAGADLDLGVLLLELPDRAGHPGDIRVGGAAAAGDQADALGASPDARLGVADHLVRLEPGVLEHVRRRAGPLRAVEAVLGAQAALDVDQVVQLDAAAEVAQPDLEGRRHRVHQLVLGALQAVQGLGTGGQLPGQGLLGQRIKPGQLGLLRGDAIRRAEVPADGVVSASCGSRSSMTISRFPWPARTGRRCARSARSTCSPSTSHGRRRWSAPWYRTTWWWRCGSARRSTRTGSASCRGCGCWSPRAWATRRSTWRPPPRAGSR